MDADLQCAYAIAHEYGRAQSDMGRCVVKAPLTPIAPGAQTRILPEKILAPKWSELLVLSLATLLALAMAAYGTNVTEEANFVAPAVFSIGLAVGALTMLKSEIGAIWTPLFWVRISAIAYFGVGSIVPIFFTNETRAQTEAFYQSFPDQVATYNLVNCLFMLILLVTTNILMRYVFVSKAASGNEENEGFERSRLSMAVLGLILLTVGAVVQFGIAVPFQVGAFSGNYPLFLSELGFAGFIGIFLLSVALLRQKSRLIWLVVLAAIAFAASGVILFNKTLILLPLIMLVMGFVYHAPGLRRMFLLFFGVYVIYAYSAPLVSFGRLQMIGPDGSVGQATLAERVDSVTRFVQGERRVGDSADVDEGIKRLSYVSVGTFAINQYDVGQPGHSLEYIWIVWIPRFLYPDKPIISDIARDFNYAATGSIESSATPGMPSEGYWNFGWLGVVLFAVLVSLVMTAWSRYTIMVVQSEAWHLFFIVLMGMRMGFRIDGLFVTDLIGPILFAALGHIALQFFNRLIVRRDGLLHSPLAAA